jgi:hypothetical protein
MSCGRCRRPHRRECVRQCNDCCRPRCCNPCRPNCCQRKKLLECCEVRKSCGRVVLVCKEKGCNRSFEQGFDQFNGYELDENETFDESEEDE